VKRNKILKAKKSDGCAVVLPTSCPVVHPLSSMFYCVSEKIYASSSLQQTPMHFKLFAQKKKIITRKEKLPKNG
jgi:hypothetical protein